MREREKDKLLKLKYELEKKSSPKKVPPPPRTVWVIDGSYLMHNSSFYGQIDYLQMKTFLESINGGPIAEGHFFDNVRGEKKEDFRITSFERFIHWLSSPQGPNLIPHIYELKNKTTFCKKCESEVVYQIQSGVDTGMAILITQLLDKRLCDRLIISTGDADLTEALSGFKLLSDKPREVWLTGFDGTIAPKLLEVVDKYIKLDDYWEQIKRMGNK